MIDANDIAYKIVVVFFKLLGRIPRRWARRGSGFLGELWFAVDKRHRRMALDNLTRAFGSEKSGREIRQIAKQVFRNIVYVVCEVGWSLHLHPKDLGAFFSLKGFANLRAAVRKGKGALILTGHLGNWELMPVAAAMAGYSANVLYRPIDYAPLDRFFVEARARFGLKMIPKDASLLRVFRALKRGETVAMLLDQNVGLHKGVMVDFFGQRACTSYGLAYIALKTGAPVLPFFVVRDGRSFTAEIGPEISLIKTGDDRKDLEENTRQYNEALETIIRRYPDQWFWIHNRWKTRPHWPWPREADRR
ncbi:MAG: lysophospholipid acyltransferase family protein [Desulfobacterales bacterium]